MEPNRIERLRNLIYTVRDNAWKRNTGSRSERRMADESDTEVIGRLCGALDEALTELERLSAPAGG